MARRSISDRPHASSRGLAVDGQGAAARRGVGAIDRRGAVERGAVGASPSAPRPAAPGIPRLVGGAPLSAEFQGAVVALGNFDGIHLGHQAVIAQAVEMARARDVATIVATFDPHPIRHFRRDVAAFRLTTLDQRQHLLAALGVDALMVFTFDDTLASVVPEAFVTDWLRGAGGIVTGREFGFGRARAGNVAMLAELGARRSLACAAVDSVTERGETVSSSRVRAALRAGDCAAAARLLTRPYTIDAVLRPGRRLDPALALLDASIAIDEYLRPRAGVYAVRARLDDGRVLGGSAYLAADGSDDDGATLELFLVDLDRDDLGRRVAIEFIAHLHDASETYAPSKLRKRIERDRRDGRALLLSDLLG